MFKGPRCKTWEPAQPSTPPQKGDRYSPVQAVKALAMLAARESLELGIATEYLCLRCKCGTSFSQSALQGSHAVYAGSVTIRLWASEVLTWRVCKHTRSYDKHDRQLHFLDLSLSSLLSVQVSLKSSSNKIGSHNISPKYLYLRPS